MMPLKDWLFKANEYALSVYGVDVEDLGGVFDDVVANEDPIEWVEHKAEKYDLQPLSARG